MALIARYKLDGNANDALGKYNGTASNVTWVDGKLGKAGSFNGNKVKGKGITTEMLNEIGIKTLSEKDLEVNSVNV